MGGRLQEEGRCRRQAQEGPQEEGGAEKEDDGHQEEGGAQEEEDGHQEKGHEEGGQEIDARVSNLGISSSVVSHQTSSSWNIALHRELFVLAAITSRCCQHVIN